MDTMHTTPTVPTDPTALLSPTGPRRADRRYGPGAAVARAAAHAVERLEDRRLFAVAGLTAGTWTSVGPTTVTGTTLPGTQVASGRVSGIATDPADVNTFYVATVGGGVWKTTNGGTTYTTTTGSQPALNIGAIAISPSNPDVVYAGTGNGDQDADATYGQGILKTVNGGATWQLVGTQEFARQTVAKIAVDPLDPGTVYVAVQDGQVYGVTPTAATVASGGGDHPAGIYKSTDGGNTWVDTTGNISTDDNFYDVEISPGSTTDLFATFQSSTNGQSGVYESTDAGLTWNIKGDFPVLENDIFIPGNNGSDDSGLSQDTNLGYGRISLAISPDQPDTIYASLSSFYDPTGTDPSTNGGAGGILSADQTMIFEAGYVVVSNDGGETWTQLDDVPIFSTHGETNNAIITDPANPSTFYIGGSPVPDSQLELNEELGIIEPTTTGTNANAGELYQATGAGAAYNDITLSASGTTGPGANINALAYDTDNRLLVGTDQGVWRLDDATPGAIAWTDLSAGLNDATVRSVSVEPTAGDALYTADGVDGSQHLTATAAAGASAQLDGQIVNQVLVDPADPSIVYQTTGDLTTFIEKSTDGGTTFTPVDNGITTLPLTLPLPTTPVLAMDPDDPNRLLLGVGDLVYESLDGAATWNPVAEVSANVSAIGIGNHGSFSNSNPSLTHVYLAAADGTVYETDNDFSALDATSNIEIDVPTTGFVDDSNAANGTTLVPPQVDRLVVDSVNSSTVFAVVDGFSSDTTTGNTDGTGGHIYMSADAGIPTPTPTATAPITAPADTALGDWTDITGNLPNVPVHDLVDAPGGINGFTRTLYAATDRGVYVSRNDGQAWAVLGVGLPTAPVYSLAYDPATHVLVAGTYGRGVYEISTTNPGAEIASRVFDDVNGTGVADPTEPGVPGATIQLFTVGADGLVGTADDVLVATTTSGSDGAYAFTGLGAGSYYVHADAPAGYFLGPTDTAAVVPAGTVDQTNGLVGYLPAATSGSAVNPATGDTAAVAITDVGTLTPTQVTDAAQVGVYQKALIVTTPYVDRPATGNTTVTFNVTISPANNTVQQTVPYTTANGSGLAGTDYVAQSGVLTFAPGVTTQAVTVTVLGNAAIQPNKTFFLDVTAPNGFVTGDAVTQALIINDNFPVATIAAAAVTRDAIATELVSVPVYLSQAAPFDTSVEVSTSDGTAGQSDYDTAAYTLIFPAGTTKEVAQFEVQPGTNAQLDKTFDVSLSYPLGVTLDPTASVAPVTIVSNALPTVSAADAAITTSVTGLSTLTFDVNLSASIPEPVTVNYNTVDGTALAGTDYTAVSGTVTFAPGEIQQTVTVPIARRFVSARDLTLGLALSAPTGGIALATATPATGTIIDPGTASVAIAAGQRTTYTDGLGQRVTLSLRGAGSAQIVFAGTATNNADAEAIVLNGTTAASALTVTVARGGQTTVSSVQVNGSLGTFSAKGLNVTGGTFVTTGGVSSVSLGYLSASAMTIGGSAGSVALTFNRVVNSSITSSIPIRTLTAGAYVNSSGTPQYITAPAVGPVHVRGTFGGTIRSGSVTALYVTGAIQGGGIESTGKIGTITAASVTDASFMAGVTGTAGLPTAAAFTNAASAIGRVSVKAGFSDSVIAADSVGRVTLGSVQTTAGGTPFGVSGKTIAGVRATAAGTGKVVNVTDPKTAVSLDNFEVDPV